MKKKTAIISSFAMAAMLAAFPCSAEEATGTGTATAQGFGGEVSVTVTVDADGVLTDVVIEGADETPDVGGAAIESMAEAMIEAQSIDVDGVSGATYSSTAVLEAAQEAYAIATGQEIEKEEIDTTISFTPGTYTATTIGMAGEYHVSVTFTEDAIESIDASDNNETLMVGTEAIRILSEKMIENQSLGVDTVSGATVTSNSFISAVKDCVEQAGGSVEALEAVPVAVEDYADETNEADILIVGGGLAGISAAISAVENGGNVILLEMKEYLGGNSVLSTGTFILGGTTIQAALGIEDDADTFYEWEMENSGYTKDPVQVRMVADNSQTLVDWFASLGVNFNTDKVNSTDGSEINRGHALSPNIGTGVSTLVDQLEAYGVDVRLGTRADGYVLNDDGEIIGVTATCNGETVEYYGKQIVLATGGWGDNNDMIVQYWGEEYDGLVYGGSKGMDGTMLLAAQELGADTVDMEEPHIDATLEVTRGVTITTNLLRNCSGILIRQSTAERFADEQSSHSEIAAAEMHEIGDEYYYEIVDETVFTYSEAVTSKAESYVNMGIMVKYDSLEEMAEALELDIDALTATIESFNAAANGETEDAYGRTSFNGTLEAPFYVLKVSNGVACTTGGLKINEDMQVLDTDGNVMANLYAIGEISGGMRVNYVGGDSLSHAAISGMVLGETLALQNAEE
ncbi:MAG: FAD-dependent oxidoreductase [Clostridiales bacterium]|nr:FAD-dependent oxidoreductase [Clostridiales bacterium]